jgi:HEPN domain-containing protein
MGEIEAPGIYLEDLCFNAQQAAEKAIKAVFIKRQVKFPHSHNIAELLTLLQRIYRPLPDFAKQAAGLTRFAVLDRYPRMSPSIRHEEYEEALAIARRVIQWAEGIVESQTQA